VGQVETATACLKVGIASILRFPANECVPYDAQFSSLWEITKESEYRHTRTSSAKRGLDLVKVGLDLTMPFFYSVLPPLAFSGKLCWS
jgi:hypothetical protein